MDPRPGGAHKPVPTITHTAVCLLSLNFIFIWPVTFDDIVASAPPVQIIPRERDIIIILFTRECEASFPSKRGGGGARVPGEVLPLESIVIGIDCSVVVANDRTISGVVV